MQGTHDNGFFTDRKVGLTRVRAGSPTNVWAIGVVSIRNHFYFSWNDLPTFIAHWDGKNWSDPYPALIPGDKAANDTKYEYKAVEAAGRTGWLAVRVNNFHCMPVSDPEQSCWHSYVHANIYRWQGRSWAQEKLPDSQNALMNDLLAVSEKDVWAVGARGKENGRIVDEDGEPWAWHWDGVSWQSASTGLPQFGAPTAERLLKVGLDRTGKGRCHERHTPRNPQ
jgi:hypothetical protein